MLTEKQKMLTGKLYDPREEELRDLRARARSITEAFNQTPFEDRGERTRILKSLFGSTGEHLVVESNFNCDYGENIHVGENFYANFGCVILDSAEVIIGDDCLMGPQAGIYTSFHPVKPNERLSGFGYAASVRLGNNCWIGGNTAINPGVSIGDNVVIASGSTVTKDFGNNLLIGGTPAIVIREL